MSKIEGKLRDKLAADPHQSMALIVRTEGDPTPYLPRLAQLGLQVRRQFKLLPAVAVSGPARAALSLLDEDWVSTIEEDRPVTTM